MFNRTYKHLHKETLCFHCDQLVEKKEQLYIYSMSGRGYGSSFDSCHFTIQLCSTCNQPEYETWFNEEAKKEEYVQEFQYEESIINLIHSFPIENQEYIWNGMDSYSIPRQDWIDMQLGLLPDEKYEYYGMFSPRQILAYEKRFSTCKYPIDVVYSKGSIGCRCPFGAFGEEGQVPSINISEECFSCSHYEKREKPIKQMTKDEFETYKTYIVGKLNYLTYKEQFEEE